MLYAALQERRAQQAEDRILEQHDQQRFEALYEEVRDKKERADAAAAATQKREKRRLQAQSGGPP